MPRGSHSAGGSGAAAPAAPQATGAGGETAGSGAPDGSGLEERIAELSRRLLSLETGDLETMWRVVEADISPGASDSPPINILTDSAALLARAALHGVKVPQELWRTVSARR